jgi:hypothetical protein
MFREKILKQTRWPPEAGAFQFPDRLGKNDHVAFRRQVEQTKRASDTKPSLVGGAKTFPLVDQQYVGVKQLSESDRGAFSFIEAGNLRHAGGVVNLKPVWRGGDPVPDR